MIHKIVLTDNFTVGSSDIKLMLKSWISYRHLAKTKNYLSFSNEHVILDTPFPNKDPFVTTYTRVEIDRRPDHYQRECRELNPKINILTCIKMNLYHAIVTLWRHSRYMYKKGKWSIFVLLCNAEENKWKLYNSIVNSITWYLLI